MTSQAHRGRDHTHGGAHGHTHSHGYRHGHAHDHAAGDHHGHAHNPDLVAPTFSLLRLSAIERLAAALALSAAIWAATWWALH